MFGTGQFVMRAGTDVHAPDHPGCPAAPETHTHQGWIVFPSASIATSVSMRRIRVSGFLALWTR